MSQDLEFSSATVLAKANIYFDGNVISHTVITSEGERKTLGVILPGEYEFDTKDPELMEIFLGDCDVKIADAEVWTTISEGNSFNVGADSKFLIRVQTSCQYICSFLKE